MITTPTIHEALAFLIDHLPPSFRLIITTRAAPPLPLARWRARNQLTGLRADDLRYNFRGMAASGMGMAYLKQGNVLEAEKAMAEANRMSRAAGNFYMQVAFALSQVHMQRARGSWRRALETCHENLA